MTPTERARRFHAASGLAREAGLLALSLQGDLAKLGVRLKGLQDYLTEADGAVERLIVERLGGSFPGDAFLGEEGGGTVGRNTWVIDPIDGTANYARRLVPFSVSIALVAEGEIEVGVIYNPATDELFQAERGNGATCNGRPMRVSQTSLPGRAMIEMGWSPRLPMAGYLKALERIVAGGAMMGRSGAGALSLAHVADGRLDGAAELHINSWDVLAGILMVREAGGWTNDFLAGEGLTRGNPIMAAAPGIKDFLVGILSDLI
ncbi:MAG: inositol monophosphatase [Proteobacteria bacterium]|nr:inositol monophosphatase [Pseudomonadota bacterium]MBI3497366.1 inositol monophosphatase [Pseudomonadota bacterium]